MGSNQRDEQILMQQSRHPQHPVEKLTPQEVAVFKDCMREGFYSRCVPISAMLATATYMAVQKGYLKKNPRFGALGKVSLALGVGYFVGKLSYYRVCYNRLLNVPGGVLAKKHREMKEQLGQGAPEPGFFSLEPLQAARAPASSEPAFSSLDLEAPPLADNDFTRSFSEDYTLQEDRLKEPLTYIPPATSYDELRRQNREQYENEKYKSLSKYPPSGSPDRPTSQPIWEADNKPQRPKKKNAYGDEFDQ